MYVSQSISVSANVMCIVSAVNERQTKNLLTWDEANDELCENYIADNHQRSESPEISRICQERDCKVDEVTWRKWQRHQLSHK